MTENNGVVGMLIAAFVMVILGVSLIGVIATQANEAVDKERVTEAVTIVRNLSTATGYSVNETAITLANPPTGWKTSDCPISTVLVWNTTIAGDSDTLLTLTTHYTIDANAGTITFVNGTDFSTTGDDIVYNNLTNVRYDYCADEYINSDFGRTVLPLVSGFFALALLGVGLTLFFKVGKATGLI